jgi:hypothetical protein
MLRHDAVFEVKSVSPLPEFQREGAPPRFWLALFLRSLIARPQHPKVKTFHTFLCHTDTLVDATCEQPVQPVQVI